MLRYAGGAAVSAAQSVNMTSPQKNNRMSTAIAKNLMAEMKLLGMADAFDRALNAATRDQSGYTEFLDALLQAEAEYRQSRKTSYRIKAARFTQRPNFEDFDFTADRSITKAQIKEIYSLSWLVEGRPLLLIGQTGVGKTFIAQAAGLHACASGYSVLYMSITTWLENIALARSSGTYLKYRDKLSKPDLIIFDEFGARKLSSMRRRIFAKSSRSAPSASRSPSPRNFPLPTGAR